MFYDKCNNISLTKPKTCFLLALFCMLAITFSMSLHNAYADNVSTIPIGSGPLGIVFDPQNGNIYTANSAGGTVSVISSSTNTVVSTININGSPSSIGFDSSNGNIYVSDGLGNTVSVISSSTNTVVSTITVGSNPQDIAFDSVNRNLYVPNYSDNTVSVISGSTNTVVSTITVGTNPTGAVFDAANKNIYVANTGDNTVSVISGSTNKVVTTINVGDLPVYLAYDSINGNIYVSNENGASISVISGSTNKVITTINDVVTPKGLAFDSVNGYIFVANGNAVIVISGSTNKVVTTIGVGNYPFDTAFDSSNGSIYVTNQGGGTISVISQFIILNPSSGPRGAIVMVTGSDFAPSSNLHIMFDSTNVTPSSHPMTDSKGKFSTTFTVPQSLAGSHTVTVIDSAPTPHSTSALFLKVNPAISLSQSSGPTGTTITITGSNFTPSHAIRVTDDGDLLSTTPAAKSNISGSFNVTFIVPLSDNTGTIAITASDGINHTFTIFTIT